MKQLIILAISMVCATLTFAQSAPIAIDGRFDDWGGLSSFTDTPESLTGVDLLSFEVTNDEEFLFIRLEVDQEIDLTDNLVAHTIYLYIDGDNDAGTGFGVQTGYGSEIGINFRQLFAYFDAVSPSVTVNFADIRLRCLPTVTSNIFEIAIGRDVMPDGVTPLFTSPTIKLLFRNTANGDRMPNSGDTFSYTFDETSTGPQPALDINKSNADYVRLVAYNVLGDGLTNPVRQPHFEDVITALNPDIIGFSESSGTSEVQVKNLLDAWLPTGAAEGWYVAKDDYDMITASRWPIIGEWAALDRQFPALIDLPSNYANDLLFVNSHLNCCANETARQAQADEFASFMLDAKAAGGAITLDPNTPVVYAGDLNLVGWAQQLNTLVTGDIQDTGTWGPGGSLDWDNTDLTDQICMQTDKRMAYTWRDDAGGSYPPGRLDFIIFSDAVMTAEKSFTLQTEVMPPARLALYGLGTNSTSSASDHFPVTTDFSLAMAVADADGDGVEDALDNCVATYNPDQLDADMDGVGDACDLCPTDPNKVDPGSCGCNLPDEDNDGDGIFDCVDNCPAIANVDQADWNGDGMGDVCQDSDSDGINDDFEILVLGSDPGNPDTDNDGLSDGDELNIYGTNLLVQDTDGDGLTDSFEVNVSLTSPLNPDTDGDGCNDAMEWGQQCPDSPSASCAGDLDFDGIITTADLLLFLGAFGQSCD